MCTALVLTLLLPLFTHRTAAQTFDSFFDIWYEVSLDSGQQIQGPLQSFDWGMTRDSKKKGETTLEDIVVTKQIDAATPKLMLFCAQGHAIPKGKIHLRHRSQPMEYFTMSFTNALCTSYSVNGSSGEQVPTEQISLNFEEIKFEYKPQGEGKEGEPTTGETVNSDNIKSK